MMGLQWILLVCHGIVTLLVVVSFLCGQWPIFENTFIQRIHIFLTFGAFDYFRRFVEYVFGSKGSNALYSIQYYCCDRPNPILQWMYGGNSNFSSEEVSDLNWGITFLAAGTGKLDLLYVVSGAVGDNIDPFTYLDMANLIYLAIIGGTYYLVVYTTFNYIPGHYLGAYHRYTSLAAVGVGILLFLLTSFSDPGTVNADNVSQYLCVYPYDNIIYSEKECPTCKILKPARSKHCGICDRCVARFDHHCGWMNNCIGEKNTVYFVMFLLWHFLLCVYGTAAIGLVLAGRLKELEVVHILTVYYGIENSFRSLAPHVAQWLIGSYNTQILLMVFLAIVSLLLSGFFGYHLSLCLSNTTTNETFKWQDYLSWQRKVKEAKASAEALKASLGDLSQEIKPPQSKWKAFFKRSHLEEVEIIKENIYDRGFFRNLFEIIYPLSSRRTFLKQKLKAG